MDINQVAEISGYLTFYDNRVVQRRDREPLPIVLRENRAYGVFEGQLYPYLLLVICVYRDMLRKAEENLARERMLSSPPPPAPLPPKKRAQQKPISAEEVERRRLAAEAQAAEQRRQVAAVVASWKEQAKTP